MKYIEWILMEIYKSSEITVHQLNEIKLEDKNVQIIDNAYGILGIEFMAAAQALDFRDYSFGTGVTKAKEVIRKYVDFLDVDRPLYPDHDKMKELVKSCEILEEIEKIVGSLE